MKQLMQTDTITIPSGVKVDVKSRVVNIKGKFGELTRSFRHLPVEIIPSKNGKFIRISMYHAASKTAACLRTLCSHLKNMMNGVIKKYEYKMRFVYAHFPINLTINDGGKHVEIRNFLGEKRVRTVKMLAGVTCQKTPQVKDEISLIGTDVELVSRSAALIHQSTLVRRKDIRKFLDGIYVSETGYVVKEE